MVALAHKIHASVFWRGRLEQLQKMATKLKYHLPGLQAAIRKASGQSAAPGTEIVGAINDLCDSIEYYNETLGVVMTKDLEKKLVGLYASSIVRVIEQAKSDEAQVDLPLIEKYISLHRNVTAVSPLTDAVQVAGRDLKAFKLSLESASRRGSLKDSLDKFDLQVPESAVALTRQLKDNNSVEVHTHKEYRSSVAEIAQNILKQPKAVEEILSNEASQLTLLVEMEQLLEAGVREDVHAATQILQALQTFKTATAALFLISSSNMQVVLHKDFGKHMSVIGRASHKFDQAFAKAKKQITGDSLNGFMGSVDSASSFDLERYTALAKMGIKVHEVEMEKWREHLEKAMGTWYLGQFHDEEVAATSLAEFSSIFDATLAHVDLTELSGNIKKLVKACPPQEWPGR